MRRLAVDRGRWKEFVENLPNAVRHHGEEKEEEKDGIHYKLLQ
jgi:hypothetical protein